MEGTSERGWEPTVSSPLPLLLFKVSAEYGILAAIGMLSSDQKNSQNRIPLEEEYLQMIWVWERRSR